MVREVADEDQAIERVGFCPTVDDGFDGLRDPVNAPVEIERKVIGTQDAEVMDEGGLVAALQSNGYLLDDVETQIFEDGHEIRERSLPLQSVDGHSG